MILAWDSPFKFDKKILDKCFPAILYSDLGIACDICLPG